MKVVVAREVERFLFRPGLQERARYYGVIFLNQMPLSHAASQGDLAGCLRISMHASLVILQSCCAMLAKRHGPLILLLISALPILTRGVPAGRANRRRDTLRSCSSSRSRLKPARRGRRRQRARQEAGGDLLQPVQADPGGAPGPRRAAGVRGAGQGAGGAQGAPPEAAGGQRGKAPAALQCWPGAQLRSAGGLCCPCVSPPQHDNTLSRSAR